MLFTNPAIQGWNLQWRYRFGVGPAWLEPDQDWTVDENLLDKFF